MRCGNKFSYCFTEEEKRASVALVCSLFLEVGLIYTALGSLKEEQNYNGKR